MKKVLCILAIVLVLAGTAYAGAIYDGSITASETAQGLSSSVPETAKKAMISVSGCDAYCSLITAATSSSGHKLLSGDMLILDNYRDIKAFRVITTSACSATPAKLYYSVFD